MRRTATIDSLPDLCLSLALSRLPPGDLARAAAVCRRWAALIAADDAALWRRHVLALRSRASTPVELGAASWRAAYIHAYMHPYTTDACRIRAVRQLARTLRLDAAIHVHGCRTDLVRILDAVEALHRAAGCGTDGDMHAAHAPPTGSCVDTATGDVILTHDDGAATALALAHAGRDKAAHRALLTRQRAAAQARLEAAEREWLAETAGQRDREQYRRRREGRLPGRSPSPPRPTGRALSPGEGLPASHAGLDA